MKLAAFFTLASGTATATSSEAQARAQRVEVPVGPQQPVVQRVAQMGEPFGVADHAIGQIAVHDHSRRPSTSVWTASSQIATSPKFKPAELARDFVVIARQ